MTKQDYEQIVITQINELISIHTQLSKEIVGSNDFHIGAIRVLNILKQKIK